MLLRDLASQRASQEPLGSKGPLAESPEQPSASLVAAADSLAAAAFHNGSVQDAGMASTELQRASPDDAGSTEHDEDVAEAAPDVDDEPVDLLDSDEEGDDNEPTDEHLNYFT